MGIYEQLSGRKPTDAEIELYNAFGYDAIERLTPASASATWVRRALAGQVCSHSLLSKLNNMLARRVLRLAVLSVSAGGYGHVDGARSKLASWLGYQRTSRSAVESYLLDLRDLRA